MNGNFGGNSERKTGKTTIFVVENPRCICYNHGRRTRMEYVPLYEIA